MGTALVERTRLAENSADSKNAGTFQVTNSTNQDKCNIQEADESDSDSSTEESDTPMASLMAQRHPKQHVSRKSSKKKRKSHERKSVATPRPDPVDRASSRPATPRLTERQQIALLLSNTKPEKPDTSSDESSSDDERAETPKHSRKHQKFKPIGLAGELGKANPFISPPLVQPTPSVKNAVDTLSTHHLPTEQSNKPRVTLGKTIAPSNEAGATVKTAADVRPESVLASDVRHGAQVSGSRADRPSLTNNTPPACSKSIFPHTNADCTALVERTRLAENSADSKNAGTFQVPTQQTRTNVTYKRLMKATVIAVL